LLCIVEHRGMTIARTQPVLQDERGYATGVQPLGDLLAFMVHRKVAIAAARTDHHGGRVADGLPAR
jgi:hypothetical protein